MPLEKRKMKATQYSHDDIPICCAGGQRLGICWIDAVLDYDETPLVSRKHSFSESTVLALHTRRIRVVCCLFVAITADQSALDTRPHPA
jgi:hypothetical protein